MEKLCDIEELHETEELLAELGTKVEDYLKTECQTKNEPVNSTVVKKVSISKLEAKPHR